MARGREQRRWGDKGLAGLRLLMVAGIIEGVSFGEEPFFQKF